MSDYAKRLDGMSLWISRVAAAIVIFAGATCLLGWAINAPALKTVAPGGLTMKVNTATCFILVGLCLLGLGRGRGRGRDGSARWPGPGVVAGSAATIALALASMAEYAFGVDLRIDQFFVVDAESELHHLPPGRMAFATASNFVLVGVAILVSRRRGWLAQLLMLPVGLVVAVCLLGFLFNEKAIYAISPYTSLAFNTTLAFAAAALGVLCVVPGSSPMTVLFSPGEAGASLRRLLVVAVGACLVLDRVVLEAGRAGYFALDYGMALSGTLVALVLVVILWANATLALRVEGKRNELQARLDEQRRWYEVTLSSIGDAVIATDVDGRVTFMNRVAESLTGWPVGDGAGRDLVEVFRIIDEAGRRPVEDPTRRVLQTGAVVGLANHTILIARDGRETAISDSAAPIQGPEGSILGVVLVFRDASADRAAEAAMKQAARSKDEFLAMLAHELRNPLAAVNHAVSLINASKGQGEDLEWSVSVIGRQVAHLSRMIDDLLDVSRITRGKISLKRKPTDAVPIIRQAVETARSFIDSRGHELAVDLPAQLWLDIDPTRFEQVLVNLLTNAAKYTEGSGRIALKGELEGPEALISVRDNGMGIAPEQIASMFDLFAQGERSIARSEGGLGIGLTIVRVVVELHGGQVHATSEGPGRGAEFVVRLPAIDPPQPEASPEASPTPAKARPGPRQARILVVDDNVDTARGLTRLLKILGHDVRTAHDGPSAVEVAREYQPEVIVLDIGLPGMSGYEVATVLRGDPWARQTLIIAATGYGNEDDRRRSRESGFDHHLVKPVDSDALLALIGTETGRSGA